MDDAAAVQPGSQAARGPINGNMQCRKRRAGFKEKNNNELSFKHTEFSVPMGYLGRVFYVLEVHTISRGILWIVDVPGVVQLTVPSSSLCSKRQTLETDNVTLIS